MKQLYRASLLAGSLGLGLPAAAQTTGSVGIGTTTPDASALLELSTTNKGLLLPRLTLVQRNAIQNPAAGLMIYQTDNTPGLYLWGGSSWSLLPSAAQAAGDNLGNHTATQNLRLNGNWLSNDGGSEGLRVLDDGRVAVGVGAGSSLAEQFTVGGGANVDVLNRNNGTTSNSLRFGNASGEAIGSARITGSTNRFGLDFYTNGERRLSISNSGRVGVGTLIPISRLANTSANIVGADNERTVANSLTWAMNAQGYAGAFFNQSTNAGANGLAIKVAANGFAATALDVSRGTQQDVAGTSLLRVRADGNVGIGTSTPATRLHVIGVHRVVANGEALQVGSSVSGGHAYLGFYPSGFTTRRAYLGYVSDGSTSFNIINQYNGNLVLGTNNTPRLTLSGGGNATLTGNLTVAGSVAMGWTMSEGNTSINGRTSGSRTLSCPAGMRLLGGGGGHRDFNSAASDIVVNYSGPDPAAPETRWRIIVTNNSNDSRALRIYCTCARIAP